MILYFLIIIFFVIFDRFFKFLAINNFFNQPIRLIGDFFQMQFVKNYYIAFSLPFKGIFLNILIILIIILLLYYLIAVFKRKEYGQTILLVLIILGAISNLFDRIRLGYVVDYLDLKYFTVFNLADVMIVGGVIGLLILNFFNKKTPQRSV